MSGRRVLLPRLLRCAQAAEYLAMSETKFRELVDGGAISEAKDVDGMPRWDVKDLDEFADSRPYRQPSRSAWDGKAA